MTLGWRRSITIDTYVKAWQNVEFESTCFQEAEVNLNFRLRAASPTERAHHKARRQKRRDHPFLARAWTASQGSQQAPKGRQLLATPLLGFQKVLRTSELPLSKREGLPFRALQVVQTCHFLVPRAFFPRANRIQRTSTGPVKVKAEI